MSSERYKNKSNHFSLKKPRFSVIFGVIYFVLIAGFTAYSFMPKTADASSEERLYIPTIGLIAQVKNIERSGNQLIAPDEIAGAYQPTNHKTVIIGHSSTVFKDLKSVKKNDNFNFDGKTYAVKETKVLPKSLVDMEEIVSETEKNTVILMTCSGEPLGGQDYSHRLIIEAEEV